jgi:ABC-2 type transport system ATP-binding protein
MQDSHYASVVIRVTNLTKHYGSLTAVNSLNLDIYLGEIFGILGPNGAGKSTSINMICGLIRPDAGEIRIKGTPAMHNLRLRNSFGLCPQDLILWPKLTCLEQLAFVGEMYDMPARDARKSGMRLLDQLGLSARSRSIAATLSGGMKRRLNICLALVHDPEVVVLDEPEAGLDPQSRVMVRDFIRSLRKNKTVILTTHNMDEADRLSDRVAIIDNGNLLLTDTPENLKKTAGTGDVLEFILHNHTDHNLQLALERLKQISPNIQLGEDSFLLRERNAIELIPQITVCLQEESVAISEIKMRANTLEDVFIQLTGKRLRE